MTLRTFADFAQIIIAVAAVGALFISIYTLIQTRNDTYLARRAYVGPLFWDTNNTNDQFLIGFVNSGDTPATNFDVTGKLISGGNILNSNTLVEGQVVLPGLGKLNPTVPFNFSNTDINKVISDPNGLVQIEFSYKDYLNKSHSQVTDFKVFVVSNKYQLQPVKQTIVQ